MLQLTQDFKKQVVVELKMRRQNYGGTDTAFAKTIAVNASVWSQINHGKIDGLLRDSQWLSLGREMGIAVNEKKWNVAKTDVYLTIEEDIKFCKQYAKARICVDECGIGKTFTAKHLSRTMKNCFYVDASQAKTKQQFIRLVARSIGVDHAGKYVEVKENIKYYLKMLPQPIVIIDEGGDLEYPAFLELKELWNGTDGACAWYMMGADGLRAKIERGIRNKKVGYPEIFSRYSERYTTIVPTDKTERIHFQKKLVGDVLRANMSDTTNINKIIARCLATDSDGNMGGLRRAESLLILNER